jgi:hypothetical protein
MAVIRIPNQLRELNLGQLSAYADFMAFELGHDNDLKNYNDSLSWLLGLSNIEMAYLTKGTRDKCRGRLIDNFPSIVKEYSSLASAGNYLASFECKSVTPEQLHLLSIPEKGILSEIKRRKKYRQAQKLKRYTVISNPEQLPAHIWTFLLDNIEKRLTKLDKEKSFLEWREIAKVIACCSWADDESFYTKNLMGEIMVDMQRINQMSRVFSYMPAIDAVRVFGFFLLSRQIYSTSPGSKNLLRKYRGTNTSPLSKEKDLMPHGAGKATSGKH